MLMPEGAEPTAAYQPERLRALDDEKLLDAIRRAFEKTTFIDDSKKVSAVDPDKHPEIFADFSTSYNIAIERGYQPSDLIISIKILAELSGFFKRLRSGAGAPSPQDNVPSWKRFELLVAQIYKAYGDPEFDVKHNVSLNDTVTGEPRQIDVLVRSRSPNAEMLIVIECKNYKRPVDVEQVERFVTKAHDLAAHSAVMVSASGFTKAATKKAQHYNVATRSLRDAERFEWRGIVRRLRRIIPFPMQFGFRAPDGSMIVDMPVLKPWDLKELTLVSADGVERRFEEVLDELGADLWNRTQELPAERSMAFASGTLLRRPAHNYSRPIASLAVTFHPLEWSRSMRLQYPTGARLYEYRERPDAPGVLLPLIDPEVASSSQETAGTEP